MGGDARLVAERVGPAPRRARLPRRIDRPLGVVGFCTLAPGGLVAAFALGLGPGLGLRSLAGAALWVLALESLRFAFGAPHVGPAAPRRAWLPQFFVGADVRERGSRHETAAGRTALGFLALMVAAAAAPLSTVPLPASPGPSASSSSPSPPRSSLPNPGAAAAPR